MTKGRMRRKPHTSKHRVDAATVAQKARLELFMNPPTKSQTVCTTTGPPSTVPGAPINKRCDTISVPDDDALQKRLHEIESQKR